MSEDLINQLTLNFLVGKATLSKLNKKMKDSQEELTKLNDKEIYRKRIEELFNNLYDNNKPNDLLQDVETGFNFFIEKAIYYLKIHDKHLELNTNEDNLGKKEEEEEEEEENSVREDSSDPDDYYNDDKDDYYSEENSDVGNASEDEESKEAVNKQFEMIQTVEKKLKKNTFISPGFDNINDINCNWFETAKQNIKKDAIIPRTNNNISEKKKNIAIIYETTNKKKQK